MTPPAGSSQAVPFSTSSASADWEIELAVSRADVVTAPVRSPNGFTVVSPAVIAACRAAALTPRPVVVSVSVRLYSPVAVQRQSPR